MHGNPSRVIFGSLLELEILSQGSIKIANVVTHIFLTWFAYRALHASWHSLSNIHPSTIELGTMFKKLIERYYLGNKARIYMGHNLSYPPSSISSQNVRWPHGQGGYGLAAGSRGRDILQCSWMRYMYFTLTVPLSSQVYKCGTGKLTVGNPCHELASHPGGLEILLVVSCY